MTQIIAEPPFIKELKRLAKKYKNITKDIQKLAEELRQNPFYGSDLGKGVRKVRMAVTDKGKGKSHGARVITYIDTIINLQENNVHLLYIYDKADQENISDKEIIELLKYVSSKPSRQ